MRSSRPQRSGEPGSTAPPPREGMDLGSRLRRVRDDRLYDCLAQLSERFGQPVFFSA